MSSNYPPGVSGAIIERHFHEATCETCGHNVDSCFCPDCPVCGEAGNPYCYEHGHLHYTREQLIGQTRANIAKLRDQIQDCEVYLAELEQADSAS